ncbi:MAG: alcohol dehydrogenase, partial [Gemmatimonadetes bacterium]|nr:alcohol dehydrogenase [Gemmatimonadota bacterium]
MSTDYAFEMGTSNLRFGPGSTREVGMDLSEMGIRRVLLVADPNLTELPPVQTAIASIEKENVDYHLYSDVRVEPTDTSFQEAIALASEGDFDAFVAV